MNVGEVLRRWLPWKPVMLFGLFLFLASTIPTRTAIAVDPTACRSTPSVLFPGEQTCPIYTERSHGGIFVFDTSLSARPTGSTTDSQIYQSVHTVTTGFRPLALVGQLLICLVGAVPFIGLVNLLARRGRRTPSYGSVRSRRRFRVSKRRF